MLYMKRILSLVVLLLVSFVGFAQAPTNYTNINGRYRWIAGMFDSTFSLPKGATPSLRTGGSSNPGALFYRTTDSTVKYWTGTQWLTLSDSTRYVPYTGATKNVNLGQYGMTTKWLQFDTSSQAVTDRRLQWSNDDGTLQFGMTNGSTITNRIGLEQFARVKNVDATQINKGEVVYLFGASGDRAAVKKADNRQDTTSSKTLGVATEDIPVDSVGFVGTFGVVGKLNLAAYTPGDILYLDSIPGQMTKTKPQAPYHLVFIGVVERANAGNGLLFVNPQNGYELEELHNVRITSLVNNNAILAYDSVARLWKDTTLNAIGGITGNLVSGYLTKATGANTIDTSQIFQSTGKIGIGTITPTAKVTIVDSANTGLRVTTRVLAIDQASLNIRSNGDRGYAAIIEQRDSTVAGTQYQTIFRKGMLPGTGNPAPGGGVGFITQIGGDNEVYKNLTVYRARMMDSTNYSVGQVRGTAQEIWTRKNGAWDTTLVLNQGNVGIGTGVNGIDSALSVAGSTHLKSTVRLSGLPTGVGTRSVRINANGTLSVADTLANGVSGTGTTNYIPKFTSSSAIGNSAIYDNGGGEILINTTADVGNFKLQVDGAAWSKGQALTGNYSNLTDFGQVGIYATNSNFADGFGTLVISGRQDNARPILFTTYNGTSVAERMRLDASGRLGIGVTSLNNNLEVYQIGTAGNNYVEGSVKVGGATSSSGAALSYAAIGSGYVYISNLNNGGGADSRINFGFGAVTGGSPVNTIMTINQSGNVGIGITSPASALHIDRGNATASYLQFTAGTTTGQTATDGFDVGIDASGNAVLNQQESRAMLFSTNNTERMRLDSSGNLGLGVTPSAWGSLTKAIQVSNTGASIWSFTAAGSSAEYLYIDNNTYNDNTNSIYVRDGAAARYRQLAGEHTWWNAPSGTAGATVSFTQAMTLDASGRLGIGTTSPTTELDVVGTVKTSVGVQTLDVYAVNVYNTSTVNNARINLATTGTIIRRNIGDANTALSVVQANASSTGAIQTWSNSASEVARITQTGNLGIGTTSPNYLLHIGAGAANAQLQFTTTGTGTTTSDGFHLGVNNSTLNAFILQKENADLQFLTNDTERMRITSAGNVGIGTSTPLNTAANRTSVTINGTNTSVLTFASSGVAKGYIYNDGTNIDIYSVAATLFTAGGGEKMRITSGGELLINTTSDAGDYKLQVNGNTYTNGNIELLGNIKTAVPGSPTVLSVPWKLGAASVVNPTSPNRTIQVEIDGVTYYLSAKTTND